MENTGHLGGYVPSPFQRTQLFPVKPDANFFYAAAPLPERYDLREEGRSTTVKNQNRWGTCWSFGSLAALESNILTKTGGSGSCVQAEPDYSEHQLAWFPFQQQTAVGLQGSEVGQKQVGEGRATDRAPFDRGGSPSLVTAQLSSWQGAATERSIPYQNTAGKIDPTGDWTLPESKRGESVVHLTDTDFLPFPGAYTAYGNNYLPTSSATYEYNKTTEELIKRIIMDQGAVAISSYADQSKPAGSKDGTYFNYTNNCQFVNDLNASTFPNHLVCVVGWNDNYPATNFNASIRPEADGAWIVKSSWGTGYYDQGYFYLSYYDRTIRDFTSLQGETVFSYDHNYQYDYLQMSSYLSGYNAYSKTGVANVFTANGRETLKAVGIVTDEPGSVVDLEVYRLKADAQGPYDGTRSSVHSETITYAGYHTLTLEVGCEAEGYIAVANLGETYQVDPNSRSCKDVAKGIGSIYDGATWTDVAGATSASYTVSSFSRGMEGYQYRCRVSNSYATLYSNAATITLVIPKAVDNISSLEYLIDFRDRVNSGKDNYAGRTVRLTADIDMSKCLDRVPIGNYSQYATRFKGTFDGCGHTISGFYSIKRGYYMGLFGYIDGGNVQNLTVSTSAIQISPSTYADYYSCLGGICGYSANGTVKNCYNYKERGAEDDAYGEAVPTEVGDYTVLAIFAEADNYKEARVTADFSIVEAVYRVNLETNGGTVNSGALESYKTGAGVVTSLPTDVTREGYHFEGWYDNAELTGEAVTEIPANETGGKTFYAKWTAVSVPTPTPTSTPKPTPTPAPTPTPSAQPQAQPPATQFHDVKETAWYSGVVQEMAAAGLMQGVKEGEFAPEIEISRGMFVTILYRMEKEPETSFTSTFDDVTADEYFTLPTFWASEHGIVKGYSDVCFAPHDSILREQMAVILYRYAEYRGLDLSTSGSSLPYADKETISDYAKQAIQRATERGIMQENEKALFLPQAKTTRTEAAAVFQKAPKLLLPAK